MSDAGIDERMGLPSASVMERIALCPGSLLASRGLEGEATEYSKRGDRLHLAAETGLLEELEMDEQEFMGRVKREEDRLLSEWMQEKGVAVALPAVREERLWIHRRLEPVCSARLDWLTLSQDRTRALILDLKSGWKQVTVPSSNWQLRTAAVAVAQNFQTVRLVRVAINQPFAPLAAPCDYGPGDLEKARQQLFELLDRAQRADAPRVAGIEQCQYCPAKATCPEALGQVQAVARRGVVERWDLVPTEEKVRLYDACKLAEKVIESVLRQIRGDLAFNPDSIPGLKKNADQKPREVLNVQELYRKFAMTFPEMEPAELAAKFTGICGVGVTDAVKLYRELSGCSVKEADQWIDPLCKRGHRAGKIERVKTE